MYKADENSCFIQTSSQILCSNVPKHFDKYQYHMQSKPIFGAGFCHWFDELFILTTKDIIDGIYHSIYSGDPL